MTLPGTLQLVTDDAEQPDGAEHPVLARMLAGEAWAWDELTSRYQSYLISVASSYVGDEAADVVQTAWLRLFQQGHTVRDPAALRGWLVRVVQREALQLCRRRQREQPRAVDTSWTDSVVASDPTPEAQVIWQETVALLHEAMEEMPSRQGALLTLLAEHAGGYREIGRALSMPVGSISPTRARSLRSLQLGLARRGVVDGELLYAS